MQPQHSAGRRAFCRYIASVSAFRRQLRWLRASGEAAVAAAPSFKASFTPA